MNADKFINSAKLRTMGLEKATRACVLHVERLMELKAAGNRGERFERHLDLLEQCARVGRKLAKEKRDQ